MTYLTERQRDVLQFIEDRINRDGVAPTLQEIADAFGFRSTASAQKHVAHLEKKGFLERRKHQKGGLVLSSSDALPTAVDLPLYGAVAAGSPIESLPDDERVSVPSDFLRPVKPHRIVDEQTALQLVGYGNSRYVIDELAVIRHV